MTGVDQIRAGFAWSALFAAGTALASWLSTLVLTIFVSLVAGAVAYVLAKKAADGHFTVPLAAALAAASFPVWVYAAGEAGLMRAAATAVVALAIVLLLSAPKKGAVHKAGSLIWLSVYVGLGLSYAVLIRQQEPGHRLLLSAAAILVAVKVSAFVLSRIARPGSDGGPGQAQERVAGIAAAQMAAMLSLLFLKRPFGPGPLAIMALIAALAATLGEVFARMISREMSAKEAAPPLAGIEAWLIALPAFFYGFRLILT